MLLVLTLAFCALQHYAAGSGGLMSMCYNVSIKEGEAGRLIYNINPQLHFDADPNMYLFVKKYHADSNILECIRRHPASNIECNVLDERFQSDGLLGNNLTLTMPNATSSIQGSYELHVVAHGIFHPTTSCHVSVDDADMKPNDVDYDGLRPALVAAMVVVNAFVLAAIIVVLIVCRRRIMKRNSLATLSSNITEETSVEDKAKSKNAFSHMDSDYASPVATPGPACQVEEVSQEATHDESATATDETLSNNGPEGKADEKAPIGSSVDGENVATDAPVASEGIFAKVVQGLGKTASTTAATIGSAFGKIINSQRGADDETEPEETDKLIEVGQEAPSTSSLRGTNDDTEQKETEKLIDGGQEASSTSLQSNEIFYPDDGGGHSQDVGSVSACQQTVTTEDENRHGCQQPDEKIHRENTQNNSPFDRMKPERTSGKLTQIRGVTSQVNRIEKQNPKWISSPSLDRNPEQKENRDRRSVASEGDERGLDIQLHTDQQPSAKKSDKSSQDEKDRLKDDGELGACQNGQAETDVSKQILDSRVLSIRNKSQEGQGRYGTGGVYSGSRSRNARRGPVAEHDLPSKQVESSGQWTASTSQWSAEKRSFVAAPAGQPGQRPGQETQTSSGIPPAAKQQSSPLASKGTLV